MSASAILGTTLKPKTRSTERSKQSGEHWKPRAYQLRAVKWLLEHGAAALWLEPGLGKTSITYAAIKVLKNEEILDGALIVCPKRVMDLVWPAEQAQWAEFHDLSVVALHGKHKEYLATQKHTVYLINYEGIPWLCQSGTLNKMLRAGHIDTIVFDEISKMGRSTTKRYKALEKFLPRFRRRWGLTGSPAANGLMKLFGQVYVLDLGKALGPYVTHFRNRFFTPVGDYSWALQEGAEELIYDRVKPLALRMAADDYLQLPQIVTQTIKYALPPKVRELYDELDDELTVLLSNGEPLSAPGAGALTNKLRQVAGGAVFRNLVHPVTGQRLRTAAEPYVWLHDEKLDALEDLVEELNGAQLMVAYEWKHDLERLRGRFGKDLPYLGGGVSTKRAAELERAWNAGALPLLACQPQSVGHGLNFQESSARHIAWFTLTYDLELYEQLIRRLRRSGNKAARLFVYHFVGRNTRDERAAHSLHRKNLTQQALFEAVKRSRKNM